MLQPHPVSRTISSIERTSCLIQNEGGHQQDLCQSCDRAIVHEMNSLSQDTRFLNVWWVAVVNSTLSPPEAFCSTDPLTEGLNLSSIAPMTSTIGYSGYQTRQEVAPPIAIQRSASPYH